MRCAQSATRRTHSTTTPPPRGSSPSSTPFAGDEGTATAGYRGEIRIRYHDGTRYRLAVGYVGEDGIEADTPYVVSGGKLVKREAA